MAKTKTKLSDLLFLHAIILLYSCSSIAIKYAHNFGFTDIRGLLLYGFSLFLLFVYALLWQQVLKRMPVSTAMCNKSVTIIWGMVWGALLFSETISITMIIGAFIIFAGVYLVVTADE